jgi:hypothetical protein
MGQVFNQKDDDVDDDDVCGEGKNYDNNNNSGEECQVCKVS